MWDVAATEHPKCSTLFDNSSQSLQEGKKRPFVLMLKKSSNKKEYFISFSLQLFYLLMLISSVGKE